jgi:hypothetical protein
MTVPTMIDGTTRDVAAIYRKFGPQQPVAGYVTGPGVEWTDPQFALFARKIRIDQQPMEPGRAVQARCLDVERWAATAADIEPFIEAREADGHGDSTVYASISTLAELGISTLEQIPRLWVAWWPNQPGPITLARLQAKLRASGVSVPDEQVWAWQYASYAEWDVSAVFGTPDFAR